MEKKEQDPKKEPLKNYVKYSGIAFQMIAIIGIGAFAGIQLDKHFGVKSHLFTLSFLLLSVIASMYYVIRGLMK